MRRTLKAAWLGLGVMALGLSAASRADEPAPLAPGVRGLVTRASGGVAIDGSLREWSHAFCTPVHYSHKALLDRAAQFFYVWDDQAFYIGLRCLDRRPHNDAPLPATFNGDAVEFYLDARPGDTLRSKDWTDGAIHFYFTAFEGDAVKPRWVMRRGIATSETKLTGVELAAKTTDWGYELEMKIPWANFPGFQAKPGALMAVDAELCSSDGKARVDRTFAYGSPLSVQQPASQAKVQLVAAFEPEYLSAVGPATFPLWVDTPWVQSQRAKVEAVVAIPPTFADVVGEVEVRLHDVDGKIVRTLPARIESFGPEKLGFVRAVATWSVDDPAPGSYLVTARLASRTGKPLATVAPRMVSEGILSGR